VKAWWGGYHFSPIGLCCCASGTIPVFWPLVISQHPPRLTMKKDNLSFFPWTCLPSGAVKLPVVPEATAMAVSTVGNRTEHDSTLNGVFLNMV
jgi:hypothetical protein